MRLLFDGGVPWPLRHHLSGHVCENVHRLGWGTMRNGDLLNAAQGTFDVLVTTDKNLRYQQRVTSRNLAIVVPPTTRNTQVLSIASQIAAAIARLQTGDYVELDDAGNPLP